MIESPKIFDVNMLKTEYREHSSVSGCYGMPRLEIDWPEFLSDSDLLWDHLPEQWHEGAFMGNGLLGAMLYSPEIDSADDVLGWRLGRTDVVQGQNRIPIGWFGLVFRAKAVSLQMRLGLYDAEITGKAIFPKGCLRWLTYTHAEKPVIVIQIDSDPGVEWSWLWKSEKAEDPRKKYFNEPPASDSPPPVEGFEKGVRFCRQVLAEGCEHTSAWKRIIRQNGETIYLTISRSEAHGESQHAALSLLASLEDSDMPSLSSSHRQWWHRFYHKSFISLPDRRLQSFWWIQMYKFASGTRQNCPILDLMGPWFRETPWPMIWWNLNVQLAYWPLYTANHLELSESFCRTLDSNFENLVLNVPPEWREDAAGIGRASSYDCRSDIGSEKGNLVWACHNYWLHTRFTGDEVRRREKLLPLLKRAVGLYLRMLEEDCEGCLHLPPTHSPEYATAPDCNYDLALLRWGCLSIVEICREAGIDDTGLEKWRHVLDRLVDFPSEDNIWLIGRGVRLAHAHRHFSHLMMFFPLFMITWDMIDKRDLIRRSVENWLQAPPDKYGQKGYTLTAAAAMYLLMEEPDAALKYLDAAMDQFIQPNTMYMECGPCIETPMSAASVINDMLLQSRGGIIRVFPGIPESWRDASFFSLRAEGAFLVSSVMRDRQVKFVHIFPEKGGVCRFVCPFGDAVADYLLSGMKENLPSGSAGRLLTISMKAGEPVVIIPAEAEYKPIVSTVGKYTVNASFHFGCLHDHNSN